jgi:UDP-N-acetylmuramyl pentapeptide phosphotransferase/UDP-N-acetylglucosamine-1-phosphate transferase
VPFLVGLLLSAILTPIAGILGRALGILDRPGPDALKIHRRPIPLTGGIGAVAAAALSAWIAGDPFLVGVWVAAVVALAVGTLDDHRPLPPPARVGGVALAAVGFVALTAAVHGAGVVWWIVALLLVLVCANAVNIMDGQDGLAGLLALVSSFGLAVLARAAGLDAAALIGFALAGGLGGFLLWNRPQARVFLGNGGAYAVGTLLGMLAWFVTAVGGLRGLLAAGACLGPFAFEVIFTVARRVRGGDRLAAGDRLHSYDLVARTAGRPASTVVFGILGVLSAGVGLGIWFLPALGLPLAAVAAALAGSWAVLLWRRRVPT